MYADMPITILVTDGLTLERVDSYDPDTVSWTAYTRQGDAYLLHYYLTGPRDMCWHAMPWRGWEDGARCGVNTFTGDRAQAVAALGRVFRGERVRSHWVDGDL